MRRVAWWRRLKRAIFPSYLSASASDCSINANAAFDMLKYPPTNETSVQNLLCLIKTV